MGIQSVTLLFARAPVIDLDRVAQRVTEFTGGPTDFTDGDSARLVHHRGHVATFDEGDLPAQTAILASSEPPTTETFTQELQQSRRTPNAEALIAGATESLLVAEMMARSLEPKTRLEIFHATLRAVVEQSSPRALVMGHSQLVLDPEDYIAEARESRGSWPGAINIRFFAASDEQFVMDTRGLQEIGLHDLQCHFKGLDPNDVAGALHNLAHYLVDNGPVIDSGHTVAGITADDKWVCQFEGALVEPKRTVMDLNPGPEFAAGQRG